MLKKIRIYLNAIIIGIDAVILSFVLLTIFLGRIVAHPLSWFAMIAFITFLLVIHFVFISFTLFKISILKEEWIMTSFGAFGAGCIYWDEIKSLKYLQKKKYKQNVPSKAVVILAYPDFSYLEGWVREHWGFYEFRALCELLDARESDFSFYSLASVDDVRHLMESRVVKRVYFVGHGSRDSFGLSNGAIINYSEFNNERHAKEFVHQVHCGHGGGERLIDRVVPKENQASCFFFPEIISNKKILFELKKLKKKEEDEIKKKAVAC